MTTLKTRNHPMLALLCCGAGLLAGAGTARAQARVQLQTPEQFNGASNPTGTQGAVGNPNCPPPIEYSATGAPFTPLNWSCPTGSQIYIAQALTPQQQAQVSAKQGTIVSPLGQALSDHVADVYGARHYNPQQQFQSSGPNGAFSRTNAGSGGFPVLRAAAGAQANGGASGGKSSNPTGTQTRQQPAPARPYRAQAPASAYGGNGSGQQPSYQQHRGAPIAASYSNRGAGQLQPYTAAPSGQAAAATYGNYVSGTVSYPGLRSRR